MSDIGLVELPLADEEKLPLPPITQPARNSLVEGPILRTLLRLAWPNVVALTAGVCVVIAETSYIGRLGVESLAAMALVFPFVILTMTMSGGAMGGGVSSAIARALGAGDTARAAMLASHAMLIGLTFGLAFTLVMLLFGPALLQLLGGRGNVLAQAIGYIKIFFGGVVIAWLMNTLGGILRGTGNMNRARLRHLPDRPRWRAWPWSRSGAAIRHARRGRRFADRLFTQRIRHGVVHSVGPGAA
jgi:hypothetical protein